MENILVSIITVSYNSEKTIGDTIESVLDQTYKNIEYTKRWFFYLDRVSRLY